MITVKAQMKGASADALCSYLRMWLFQEEHWQIIAGNVSILDQ